MNCGSYCSRSGELQNQHSAVSTQPSAKTLSPQRARRTQRRIGKAGDSPRRRGEGLVGFVRDTTLATSEGRAADFTQMSADREACFVAPLRYATAYGIRKESLFCAFWHG